MKICVVGDGVMGGGIVQAIVYRRDFRNRTKEIRQKSSPSS